MKKILFVVLLLTFSNSSEKGKSFKFNNIELGGYIDKSWKMNTNYATYNYSKSLKYKSNRCSWATTGREKTNVPYYKTIRVDIEDKAPLNYMYISATPYGQVYSINIYLDNKYFISNHQCINYMEEAITMLNNNYNIKDREHVPESSLIFDVVLKNDWNQSVELKCSRDYSSKIIRGYIYFYHKDLSMSNDLLCSNKIMKHIEQKEKEVDESISQSLKLFE